MLKAVTMMLEVEAYQKLRELVRPKPISYEIRDLVQKRVAELEGRDPNSSITDDSTGIKYEDLKFEHIKLVADAEKVDKQLQKQGAYKELMELANGLGLVWKDLHNLNEVAPKLLDEWKGSRNRS